jgi:hypothetical protein
LFFRRVARTFPTVRATSAWLFAICIECGDSG